jgi:hypothetical protein
MRSCGVKVLACSLTVNSASRASRGYPFRGAFRGVPQRYETRAPLRHRLAAVDPERRRVLLAQMRQTGDLVSRLEQRLDVVDAALFELERLEARVERLEQWIGPRSFARDALRRQRTEAVVECRRRGMSIAVIATALGLGRTTVAQALDSEPIDEPAKVRGLDGKLHPARHPWAHGSNGDRGGGTLRNGSA